MELKYVIVIGKKLCIKVIIEPLWNWNCSLFLPLVDGFQVIIEPLWNWNVRPYCLPLSLLRYNRTFMELKSEMASVRNFRFWSYNRTFMELKWLNLIFLLTWTSSYNRTFMELKFAYRFLSCRKLCVIIEPLWNWNLNRKNKASGKG